MEVFSVKNKNKNIEKTEQKQKANILKVKINNIDLGMQIDNKKRLGTHWKVNFTKEQVTTPPIWWVGHKSFRS